MPSLKVESPKSERTKFKLESSMKQPEAAFGNLMQVDEDDSDKSIYNMETEDEDLEPVRKKKSTKAEKSVKVEKLAQSEPMELDDEDTMPVRKSLRSKAKVKIIESSGDELSEPEHKIKEDQESSDDSSDEEQDNNIEDNEDNEASEENSEKEDEEETVPEDKSKNFKQIDFISNEEEFNPALENFDPARHASWKMGENVPYYALAKTLSEINAVSSRLKMIEILANYFWSVISLSPDDLLPSIYLCLNKLAPDYEGIELGIGESIIMRAIASATGRKYDLLKAEIERKGDMGSVAESSRSMQRLMFVPPRLMLKAVFNKLKEIALMSGQSSMTKKTEKIQALLIACKGPESRYLVRSLSGKLRVGLAEQSVLVSLAQAFVLTEHCANIRSRPKFKKQLDEATMIIKNAYCQCPNYEQIVQIYRESGYRELTKQCTLKPSIPLKPMLAHPTKGIGEVLKRVDQMKFTCEFKYDGERAQIHFELKPGQDKPSVWIYSRNQENHTSKYPDLIERITNMVDCDQVQSFILDTEAVAWDLNTKQILPFQVLSTRKRKDAKADQITVQVCVYAFDLLYLNGRSLIECSLRERRELLRQYFQPNEGKFSFATSKDVQGTEQIEEFLDESLKGKCEGLMIKTLDEDATYEIAKRSHKWLKLKKDYLDGVGDTLDLVVIGAYLGKGKRTGNYGGFLLACYDEENEEFQAICKLGTGFKDEDLDAHFKFFQEHRTGAAKSYYSCDEGLKPDVWLDPVQVWEVKCADMSLSPVYRAAIGIVDSNRGISLRFPRFVRIRDDKKPEMATSAQQVAEIYQNQEILKNNEPEAEEEY